MNIKRMQSYTFNEELKQALIDMGYKYIPEDLLYYGSIGVNLEAKTFYPLAITIYKKFTDKQIIDEVIKTMVELKKDTIK